jgi:hypothetical protein
VSHHAKASSAGTIDGSGKGRLAALGAVLLAALILGVSAASAAAPTLTIESASEVGVTAAKVEGTIDPQGQPSTYRFQYISEAQFQQNLANFLPGFEGAATGIEAGTETAETVSGELTGLTAGTTYHLRLQAENGDGQQNAVAATFTTQNATAPTVAVEPAGGVTFTKAHIAGTIDPEGGNVNPAGDAVPISWALQFELASEPGNWQFAEAGTIEGAEAESSGPIVVAKDLEFLQNGTEYRFRLVVSYAGRGVPPVEGSFTTETVTAPGVSVDDAGSVTGTTAHFSGRVTAGNDDPAFETFCSFDYVTQSQFEAGEFDNPEAGHAECDVAPITGTSETAVSADVTGLTPHTVYHLRLRAVNSSPASPGIAIAADTFETESLGPAISETAVTNLTTNSATLNAKINPGGLATTYHFEYLTLAQFEADGETFAGATSTPESASIGSDATAHPATADIAGLDPDTAYRYRVVAGNALSPAGGTLGPARPFHTPSAPVAESDSCPNAQLRAENNSTALPDCRAYELVTPDLNHAALLAIGRANPLGSMLVYQAKDAPDVAHSGSAPVNYVRATRDLAKGWSSISLSPPLTAPVSAFGSWRSVGISSDLSTTVETTDQPLSGGSVPAGQNIFLSRNGAFTLVTTAGAPFVPGYDTYTVIAFFGGTPDYSSIFFTLPVKQLPSDPLAGGNTYSWSADRGLRLLGILPDGTPAPNGASFVGVSDDGRHAAFLANGVLYLRTDDAQTVEVGTLAPDLGRPDISDQAFVTADGSKVVFTTSPPQTPDANPAGRDLYSYDIATGVLSDLVVDSNPEDAAIGASVHHILGVTSNGSYIWFTAEGALAPGAVSGQRSLYVWHDGQIDFVADAEGIAHLGASGYMTPDGSHFAFASTDSLTGYDNTDPTTGQPHEEVFLATLGSGVKCVSCRQDGTRPTGNASIGGDAPVAEDGSLVRVFFQSTDAVVPPASSGRQQVFEYADGTISAISRPDGPGASFLAASASGDDVFFETYDDRLVPYANAGDDSIIDARVDGGFPVVGSGERCLGSACRGSVLGAPEFDQPASNSGNRVSPVAGPPTRAQKLAKALKACRSKHNKKKRATCEKHARRTYGRSK